MFYKVELATSSPTPVPPVAWLPRWAASFRLNFLVGHTDQAQHFKMLGAKEVKTQP